MQHIRHFNSLKKLKGIAKIKGFYSIVVVMLPASMPNIVVNILLGCVDFTEPP
jgi:hypothetical protein